MSIVYLYSLFVLLTIFLFSCAPKQEKTSLKVDKLSFIPFEKYGSPKKRKPSREEDSSDFSRKELEAPCHTRTMLVYFCNGNATFSDSIQHRSKIKVVSLETGKAVTLIVNWNKNIKGLCIPKRLKALMSSGKSFKAKVYILRCGENGVKKCPEEIKGYASWYGHRHHGLPMASGFKFNMYDLIAAHKWLPFGTILLVENLRNGKKVEVTIWDRGPYIKGRELDLSYGAAKKLDMIKDGVVPFRAKVLRCGN